MALQLIRILYEELEKEYWGTIDPIWFKVIIDDFEGYSEEDTENARALYTVFNRSVERLLNEKEF